MTTRAKNTASIIFGIALLILATVVFTLSFLYPEKYTMPYWLSGSISGTGIIFAFPTSPFTQTLLTLFKSLGSKFVKKV